MSLSTSSFKRHLAGQALGAVLTVMATVWAGCEVLRTVFSQPNWKTMAVDALGPDTQILFMGSSRFYYGIDPRLYPGSVNLSANYMNCEVMERLWRRYELELQNIKTVVLELSLSTFLYDTAALDPTGLYDLGVHSQPSWTEFFVDFDRAVHRSMQALFSWRLTPYFFEEYRYRMSDDEEPKASVAGYIPSTLRLSLPGPYAQRELTKAAAHVERFGHDYLDRNLRACTSLVSGLHSRGIQVIFVRMPREKALRDRFPESWDRMQEESVETLGRSITSKLTILDHRTLEGASTASFRDPDHLNSVGAGLLAETLASQLQAGAVTAE